MKWGLLMLTLVVGWYLHESIPRDFSEPWKLRAFLLSIRVPCDALWVLDKLGMVSAVDIIDRVLRAREMPRTEYDGGIITERLIEGVEVRMYQPNGAESDMPALVYYHGGGWALSSPTLYDSTIVPIVTDSQDLLVISVNYRQPPKHIYPAALDDCLAVTKHLLSNAADYGVDPNRIAIGGDSAGGNIAAAVALKLRDQKFSTMPKLQVLIYPVLQAVDNSLPSRIQNVKGPLLSTYTLAHYYEMYAKGNSTYARIASQNLHTSPEIKQELYNTVLRHEDIEMNYHYQPYKKPRLDVGHREVWEKLEQVYLDPYFSPLLADDLSGLPETYIYVPFYDMLRDDGILYNKRLQQDGVRTSFVLGTNTFHGICSHIKEFPKEGGECLQHVIYFLRRL